MRPILRKIETGNDYSFSIREDIYPYLYNRWHYHPELELTLIKKGEGTRLVGDSIERFGSGDLILLGKNLPHYWRSDARYFQGLPDLGVEAIAIHFREDFWGRELLLLPEFKKIRDLLERSGRGIRIYGHTRDEIEAAMQRILLASDAQRIGCLINILQLIAQSAEWEVLSSLGFASSYELANTEKINQIFQYAFNHFQEKIRIPQVARMANISPHSFCRYFKSRTQKTFGRFLLEIRLGYACKLLIENKAVISQIADSCGFNNLSNFNRQFKAFFRKTPLQYQKEFTRTA